MHMYLPTTTHVILQEPITYKLTFIRTLYNHSLTLFSFYCAVHYFSEQHNHNITRLLIYIINSTHLRSATNAITHFSSWVIRGPRIFNIHVRSEKNPGSVGFEPGSPGAKTLVLENGNSSYIRLEIAFMKQTLIFEMTRLWQEPPTWLSKLLM